MSSVRMCDRCGTVFSERVEGWGTYQGSTSRRDPNGRLRQVTESLDLCSGCNGWTETSFAGTPSIPGVAEAERLAGTLEDGPLTEGTPRTR